ncbi:hypothetical protein [Microbacterium flavescens]|jgi:hypothetical protein|uniref:hypothetical protein n=1 Tax=Microbacterium flavescens TaxID=69366 RepID=UPI001BDE335E|nr:hypothetical protein [Microbacterium flavescens]
MEITQAEASARLLGASRTPSIPVRFQVIERTVEELEHLETEPPPLDEAHWLEHSL